MRLNDLKPAPGSRKERARLGRGISAGGGKTAGRGHKGQHSRSGGLRRVGFEGGQMPLQRRLPRSGFTSHVKYSRAEVRLDSLARLDGGTVTLASLVDAGLVPAGTERVKVILAGEIGKTVTIADTAVVPTRGARAAIEKAGGSIGAAPAKPDSEPPARKTTAKKPATKKATAKKATAKKATAKKTTAKKATAKKTATKKRTSTKSTAAKSDGEAGSGTGSERED